jgi:hypothetical protein
MPQMSLAPALTSNHEDVLQTLIRMEKNGTLCGVFDDIPESVYNDIRCPGLRSGDLKEIANKSYAHWLKGQKKDSESLAFGRDFHAYMESGESQNPDIIRLGAKVMAHPDARPLIDGSQREMTFFSIDSETGILKRCRVDLYRLGMLADYKTTRDASPAAFTRDARKYLYRISAAYYLEVVSEVMGTVHREFNIIAVEKDGLCEPNVYQIADESIDKGAMEVREALRTVARIRKEGASAWRGYPLGVKRILI